MLHLGDITKINGYTVPITDCVVGGSPCQGLSIAGERKGLADERSGLFVHQVRIVKEMRAHDRATKGSDDDIRPRYLVWENVPGAFSSGSPKGEDFRIVLEEIAKIADETASIPRPEGGKWRTSGCIMGRGFSISWRVLDAQFWGTPDKPLPQRRRRIALVADFGGSSAPEILFVRNESQGHFEPRQPKRKGTTRVAESGIGESDQSIISIDRAAFNQGKNAQFDFEVNESGTRSTLVSKGPSAVAYTIDPIDSNAMKSPNPHSGFHETDVAKCLDTSAPNPAKNQGGTAVVQTYAIGKGQLDQLYLQDTVGTLNCMHDQQAVMQYVFENHSQDSRYTGPLDVAPALPSKMGTGGNNTPFSVMTGEKYIVRTLTPLEAERLQGFPDGWTNIGDWIDSKGKKRKSSDAVRYRALGNSISLPPWKWVLKRICAQYERDATLGSLFDGIGGFPLIWEQYNGKGSCLWASEIDEFPMAVTKVRFGGGISAEQDH